MLEQPVFIQPLAALGASPDGAGSPIEAGASAAGEGGGGVSTAEGGDCVCGWLEEAEQPRNVVPASSSEAIDLTMRAIYENYPPRASLTREACLPASFERRIANLDLGIVVHRDARSGVPGTASVVAKRGVVD